MAVTVIIPTALRQYAAGQREVVAEGTTIGEVLQQITTQHADFGRQIFGDDGNLRSFVNVYRNDDDVRYLDGLATPVADGDEVSIIPAIAGGK
ncbi:MAG TPA: ubiquitin-like small modifier protein 1 [Herpetosiphonaceae bacterium]